MASQQQTPMSARVPPDVPSDPSISETLTQYLRNFALWARNGFAEQMRNNEAVPGVMLRSRDTPAGTNPKVFSLEADISAKAYLVPMALGSGDKGAPILIGGSPSGSFLPLTGGTLTGDLTINHGATSAQIFLNTTATSGAGRQIWGQTGGANRWLVQLGNGSTESGSNVGTDFVIARYNDAGVNTGSPFTITRSSGLTTVNSGLAVAGGVLSANTCQFGYPTVADWSTFLSGNYRISQFASGWYWRWDQTTGQLDWIGGPNALYLTIAPAGAVVIQKNLTINGANLEIPNGNYLHMLQNCGFYSDVNYWMIGDNGDPPAGTSWKYYFVKSSGARTWVNQAGSPCFSISPVGACTCPGGFSTASDAKLKRDIEPASIGLDALRKITPSYFHRIHDEPPKGMEKIPDRREFGFIAQDVQAALPDAVTLVEHRFPFLPEGETDPEKMETKDSSSLAIEIMPMLAALTNAVKELDKRLASLEGR